MALCPVCQHELSDPPPAACPSCGTALGVAEAPPALPPPAEPFPGPSSTPAEAGTPWDDRTRLGLLTALVETTRQVLTAPGAFFRGMPVTGGLGSPLIYALIVGWLGVVATAFYQALYQSIAGPGLSGLGESPELAAALGWAQGWAGFFSQLLLGGVFVVVGVMLWSGLVHLLLLLLGGASRGFEATARVVAYAQAVSVLCLVPFCGGLVGGVWAIVVQTIGLAAAQRIGHGKAVAAVLLPLVLLCCCCAAAFGTLFAGALGLAGRMR